MKKHNWTFLSVLSLLPIAFMFFVGIGFVAQSYVVKAYSKAETSQERFNRISEKVKASQLQKTETEEERYERESKEDEAEEKQRVAKLDLEKKARWVVLAVALVLALLTFKPLARLVSWARNGAGMELPANIELGVNRFARIVGLALAFYFVYKYIGWKEEEFGIGYEIFGDDDFYYILVPAAASAGFLLGKTVLRAVFWIADGFGKKI